jgi:hypothetical protein
LAGANPDFADEHVRKRELVLAFDGHRVRAIGEGKWQRCLPRSALVGDRVGDRRLDPFRRSPLKPHGHGFARVGGAPDRDAGRALQHHVIGEEGMEFDVGAGRRHGEYENCETHAESKFHGSAPQVGFR